MIRSSLKDNHRWRGGGGVTSRQHGWRGGAVSCLIWPHIPDMRVGGDRVSRITSDALAPKHWPQVMSSNVSWPVIGSIIKHASSPSRANIVISIDAIMCRHVSSLPDSLAPVQEARDALPFSQDRCRDDVIQWCIWEKVSAVQRVQLFLLKSLQQCSQSLQCTHLSAEVFLSNIDILLSDWSWHNEIYQIHCQHSMQNICKDLL